jgi:hypothetical protein
MRTVTIIVVLAALVTGVAGAQEPKPAFEVASVKRNVLGLKLERRREPAFFDVLVIKSVELPSEN